MCSPKAPTFGAPNSEYREWVTPASRGKMIAGQYTDRQQFLAELTLDPPVACGDLAGSPHLDDDFLILSTIHSAKGQEWKHVYGAKSRFFTPGVMQHLQLYSSVGEQQ